MCSRQCCSESPRLADAIGSLVFHSFGYVELWRRGSAGSATIGMSQLPAVVSHVTSPFAFEHHSMQWEDYDSAWAGVTCPDQRVSRSRRCNSQAVRACSALGSTDPPLSKMCGNFFPQCPVTPNTLCALRQRWSILYNIDYYRLQPSVTENEFNASIIRIIFPIPLENEDMLTKSVVKLHVTYSLSYRFF